VLVGELAALKADATHWLTEPEYEVLRYRLEAAHTAAEAALVEVRRRIRPNERRNAYERGCSFEKSSRRKINAEVIA
jgi:hypothetical protein